MPEDSLTNTVLHRVMLVVPLILSLTVHEFAHAYTAFRLGDRTGQAQGRLTLNPLSHIDPVGTILLPLLGIPFGWAKPVPFNAAQMTRKVRMRTGAMIVASAGPISNLLIAILVTLGLALSFRFAPGLIQSQKWVLDFSITIISMNVSLAVFNALPIAPLDGHWVVEALMPARFEAAWQRCKKIGPFVLLAIVFFGGSLLSGPIGFLQRQLFQLVTVIAGR